MEGASFPAPQRDPRRVTETGCNTVLGQAEEAAGRTAVQRGGPGSPQPRWLASPNACGWERRPPRLPTAASAPSLPAGREPKARAGPRARRGASSPGGSGPSAARDRLVLPRRGTCPPPPFLKFYLFLLLKVGWRTRCL